MIMMFDLNLAGPQRAPDADFLDEDDASDWLRATAEQWVPELFRQGRIDRTTHELRLANINGGPPKDRGSCVIPLRGERAGSYYDHDGGDHGGPLSTFKQATGLSGGELFAEIKRRMGGHTSSGTAGSRATEKEKPDNSAEVNHALKYSGPIAGTLGELYLKNRGITKPLAGLLFNPACTHWKMKRATPTIVAPFVFPDDTPTRGIHRIYLLDDGSWYIEKKMIGPCEFGVIKLATIGQDGRLGVGEGIESTAAGMQYYDIAGWAAGSSGGMHKLAEWIRERGSCGIKNLEIFTDPGNAGVSAAQDLARAARDAGIDVLIRLPHGDKDFADDLQKGLAASDLTLPIDAEPPAQPDVQADVRPPDEIIEEITIAAALAEIQRLTENDNHGITRALKMLARSDGGEFELEDALKLASRLTKYPIAAVRKFFGIERKKAGQQIGVVLDVRNKPWIPYLAYRDVEEKKPTGGMHNVGAVLRYGDEFQLFGKSVFSYDEFALNVSIGGPLPWDTKVYLESDFPRFLENHDIRGIVDFCQGFDIPTTKDAAIDAVTALAASQTFHPVRDFFNQCHKEWDRVARLDELLTRYCNVEVSRLAHACGARWMIGSVARIFEPGCQMDTALIIEGDQGIRKSSFFRVLSQDRPWFVDQLSDMGGKDSLIETAGALIIELAELDAMRRLDVSRIKKYLAFRSDRYRPVWERLTSDIPRQCVFAGTINPDGNPYLYDTTGGRRFWCFASPAIDIEAVKRDVRQLWGEAVDRYRKGEHWWLHEPHLVDDAAKQVRERTDFKINEAWESPIVEWLRSNTEPTTIADVLKSALQIKDKVQHTKAAQMDVAAILKLHGYKRNTSVRPQTWSKPKPSPSPLVWPTPRQREPGEDE